MTDWGFGGLAVVGGGRGRVIGLLGLERKNLLARSGGSVPGIIDGRRRTGVEEIGGEEVVGLKTRHGWINRSFKAKKTTLGMRSELKNLKPLRGRNSITKFIRAEKKLPTWGEFLGHDTRLHSLLFSRQGFKNQGFPSINGRLCGEAAAAMANRSRDTF
ncbi:uncharacterized protein LOC131167785 [Malania oleifera]|uniref:uncharacterized protein LOC131167785 n=1 Tax=Malania oleifera TaxID=397392 RepID=UPI0025AE6693|nr:uncharacterized protein LOC131167785 [Malania oleifera]XP_057982652.1 uncharacterized protein LOC131167785 [Malania oleifera]